MAFSAFMHYQTIWHIYRFRTFITFEIAQPVIGASDGSIGGQGASEFGMASAEMYISFMCCVGEVS